MSFPDSVYSNINDIQTASMDYLSKYTALARCIQTNPSTSSTACSAQQTAFNNTSTNSGSKTTITTTVSGLAATSVPTVSATTYATNAANIISTNSANISKLAGLDDLINSTFYLESKRETDAVIYAWTLWLVIFIITAIGVFSYM